MRISEKQANERRDRIAELMSQGLTTVQIRTRLGMSNSVIQREISRIRKDLGWQAQ